MQPDRELHIVSFDIPFPADYGGVIDVFFKLKALHAAGVKIHLHCFEYGRSHAEELLRYCATVHYYPRNRSPLLLFSKDSYIVCTRDSSELREALLKDDHPILMEGLHSSRLLGDPAFSGRRIILRSHNIEHDYYSALAAVERNPLKRFYFRQEARKLERYEPLVRKAAAVAAITSADARHFQDRYGNAFHLPAFHPFEKVDISGPEEDFAFYHGNLSIGENDQAALFLVEKVFAALPFRLVIAGGGPTARLRSAVARHPNITLLDKLSPDEIFRHIAAAKVNVLPTFQSTGIKLKLLAALFRGRHCLVNPAMVAETGLESLCQVAVDAAEFQEKLIEIFAGKRFSDDEIEKRRSVLEKEYSNRENVVLLISRLFNSN